MNDFQRKLQEQAKEIFLDLDTEKLEKLEHFTRLLLEVNQVMNLTAITEEDEIISKHLIDSLSLSQIKDQLNFVNKVIDVGTGAGFPGIPLKIAFPEWKITCMDSLNKRLAFIQRVIEECELKEIETVHARAEDLGRDKKYRDQYDMAVSRAVARLDVLTEYCSPFVRKDGVFISYKSEKAEEEKQGAERALRLLNCKVENSITFKLPGTEIERSLLIIRKVNNTPDLYPRKAGTPGKKPL